MEFRTHDRLYVLIVEKSRLMRPVLMPATGEALTEYHMEYEFYPHAVSDSAEDLRKMGQFIKTRYKETVVGYSVVPTTFIEGIKGGDK